MIPKLEFSLRTTRLHRASSHISRTACSMPCLPRQTNRMKKKMHTHRKCIPRFCAGVRTGKLSAEPVRKSAMRVERPDMAVAMSFKKKDMAAAMSFKKKGHGCGDVVCSRQQAATVFGTELCALPVGQGQDINAVSRRELCTDVCIDMRIDIAGKACSVPCLLPNRNTGAVIKKYWRGHCRTVSVGGPN